MDVKTTTRTLEIFEIFAREQEPLSLTVLAQKLAAPVSSCLYIVRTLERQGYLYPVGRQRALYPTRKLRDLADAIAQGEPWLERIEPVLERLRDDSRETVILGKRLGTKVVYLAVHEGPETIRYVARAGDIKKLHSSAIGKALLSTLDGASLERLVAKLTLDQITPATLTDRAALLAELGETAARGYAVTRGENVAGVMAIARPVMLEGDLYALALAGPLERMQAAFAVQCARLAEAGAQLNARAPGAARFS